MSPQRKKTDKFSNSKIKQNKKQSKITQRMKTKKSQYKCITISKKAMNNIEYRYEKEQEVTTVDITKFNHPSCRRKQTTKRRVTYSNYKKKTKS